MVPSNAIIKIMLSNQFRHASIMGSATLNSVSQTKKPAITISNLEI